MVGKSLGHYEILEPLGKGGMGEVYRARDTKLDRDVAIKVLPEDFATDPDRLARFEREAKLLASLNHANIAAIYGLEDEGDQRFIVMEVVEGETLAERISRSGRIEVDEALDIARQIAEALEAAHDSGVIHRDLKPANVKVTPDGKVKVLDFGLAKAYEVDGSSSDVSPDLSHSPTMAAATQAGVILGTAAYMSPEQAKGRPLDRRTDIWAFGALLFEMLTGRSAFGGEDVHETLAAILKDQPDWDALPFAVPPTAQTLLRRCLRKDQNQRLHDIGDARIEIEDALVDQMTQPAAGQRYAKAGGIPVREQIAWASVLLLAVVVAVLAIFEFRGQEEGTTSPTLIRIATAETSSSVIYPIGVGIAQLLNEHVPGVIAEALPTDGSFENVELMDRQLIDLAFVQSDVAFHSVLTDRVLGHQSENIAGVAALFEEVAHIVYPKDGGIRSIDDLRGRTINLNLPDSGSRFSTEVLLAHFGIITGDFVPAYLTTRAAMSSLVDGSVDVNTHWGAIPNRAIQELFSEGNFELLSIDRLLLAGLAANQPFLVPVTIPAMTYPNQPAEISTVAVKSLLIVRRSMDEGLVREIVEVIFSNLPTLIAKHPRAADISLETAFGVQNGMVLELHPGVEQFRSSIAKEGQ